MSRSLIKKVAGVFFLTLLFLGYQNFDKLQISEEQRINNDYNLDDIYMNSPRGSNTPPQRPNNGGYQLFDIYIQNPRGSNGPKKINLNRAQTLNCKAFLKAHEYCAKIRQSEALVQIDDVYGTPKTLNCRDVVELYYQHPNFCN